MQSLFAKSLACTLSVLVLCSTAWADVFSPCASEPWDASGSVDAQMKSAGITDPDEQLAFLDSYIADPENTCGARADSRIRKYLLLDKMGRREDAISTLYLVLEEDMLKEPAMHALRGRLLVNLALLENSLDQRNGWVDVLKKETALVPEYAALSKALLARELFRSGERDMALSMAKAAMETAPEPSSIDVMIDTKRTQRRGDDRLAVRMSFVLLREMDEEETALEALKAVAEKTDIADFWLGWALASWMRDGAAPPQAVEIAERLDREIRPYDDTGYLSPDSAQLSAAMLVLAHRKSGQQDQAQQELKAAKKRFGKGFEPEAVLEREITRFEHGDEDEIVDAELATPVQPRWPWEDTSSLGTDCVTRLNVDEKGNPFNVTAECRNKLFEKSAVNALKRVHFKPKTVNGVAEARYNVVQPLEYKLQQ